MKILISSIVDVNNSAHNRLHQFIKILSREHSIEVLCIKDWWKITQLKKEDKYIESSLAKNVKIRYITNFHLPPFFQELLSPLLIKFSDDYDVHFNYGSIIMGYYISKRLQKKGIPTIFDIADDNAEMIKASPHIPFFLKPVASFIGKVSIKKNISIAKVITVSTATLISTYKIPKNRSVLIPNGVDSELFKKVPPHPVNLFERDSFIIGYIGVLREWVDLELLFYAMKRLPDKVKLIIIGSEGLLDHNIRLMKHHGLEKRVKFLGYVPFSELPQYISGMDVCTIPFKKNNVTEHAVPLKLFEYLACEKPVIATKLPAIFECVGDRIYYANTSDEYFSVIRELLGNKEKDHNFKNLRNYVVQNYDWNILGNKLEIELRRFA